jgi:hypothetical protein
VIVGAAKLFGEQNGSAGARDIGAKTGDDGHSRSRQYRRGALGRRRKQHRLTVYPRLMHGSSRYLLPMAWRGVLADLKNARFSEAAGAAG